MINVSCRTNGCGFRGRVTIRKHVNIETTIPHKLTEKPIPYMIRQNATSEYGASATGVPCPQCGNHTLTRKRTFKRR